MARRLPSKGERLQEFIRRLLALPPATDFLSAWEQIAKTQAVLDSLTPEDRNHVAEVEDLLKRCGCVALHGDT